MANPESSQVGEIKRTLRVVDPLKTMTVFGTAGIALHLVRYEGLNYQVPDVDLVGDPLDIHRMHKRLSADDYIGSATLNQKRGEYDVPIGEAKLDIIPTVTARILPVNVVSSIADGRYSMNWNTARQEQIERADEQTLPLDVLLAWKILAGRDKDISIGELMTDFAEAKRLIKPAAVRSLRGIIQLQRELKDKSVPKV